MDFIYGEGNSSSSDVIVQPPRKILRASHPTQRSQNRSSLFRDMIKKTHELTLAEKLDLNFDRLEPVRVLGEGAFGEVVLVVDPDDISIAAAVKRIDLRGLDLNARNAVRKEAMLQRAVKNHQNVLKYLTTRSNDLNDLYELYLEYADGGELFDQIEPDYGMPPAKAQNYFKQLIEGLEYIHSCGICHRDIKPENLLLTKDDVLKISDFGMATIFRDGGTIRRLNTRCGTMPYVAPEVMTGDYYGEPADIWSCGVVLVTMIVGEVPWQELNSREYVEYTEENCLTNRPWNRLNNCELAILKGIFTVNPNKRSTISRLKKHPWLELEYHSNNWRRKIPEEPTYISRPRKHQRVQGIPLSQPAHMRSLMDKDSVVLINSDKPNQPLPPSVNNSFSQPTSFDSMVINRSQISCSQFNAIAHPIASLVRRMTRFCVKVSVEEAIKAVENACRLCDCECQMVTSHHLQITCLRNTEISFFATVYEMIDEGTRMVLVDFRLSKGDGIEFKRRFLELEKLMANIICKNSMSWLEKHGLVRRRNVADIVAEAIEKDKELMPPPKEDSSLKAAEV